jgi:hypothetical protein
MRGKLVVTFLAGLVAGLAVALAGWHPRALAERPEKPARWGYAVYFHGDLMALGEKTVNQNLTKLGEEGWELVAAAPGLRGEKDVTTQTTYFFKKPK